MALAVFLLNAQDCKCFFCFGGVHPCWRFLKELLDCGSGSTEDGVMSVPGPKFTQNPRGTKRKV
jgi:hypothetical protein